MNPVLLFFLIGFLSSLVGFGYGLWMCRIAEHRTVADRSLSDRLRTIYPDDLTSTHYEGCWREHPRCAVLRAADLLDDGRA
jgi:hypothetical protein